MRKASVLIAALIVTICLPVSFASDKITLILSEGNLLLDTPEWKWSNTCKSRQVSCYQGENGKQKLKAQMVSTLGSAKAFYSSCRQKKQQYSKNVSGIEYCFWWDNDVDATIMLFAGKNIVSISLGHFDTKKVEANRLVNQIIELASYQLGRKND